MRPGRTCQRAESRASYSRDHHVPCGTCVRRHERYGKTWSYKRGKKCVSSLSVRVTETPLREYIPYPERVLKLTRPNGSYPPKRSPGHTLGLLCEWSEKIMDVKQTFDCPASPCGYRGHNRMVSLGESGDNREKWEGPIDMLITSTLKTAIVRILESFSSPGVKSLTAGRQALSVPVQLELITWFSLF